MTHGVCIQVTHELSLQLGEPLIPVMVVVIVIFTRIVDRRHPMHGAESRRAHVIEIIWELTDTHRIQYGAHTQVSEHVTRLFHSPILQTVRSVCRPPAP